MYTALKHLHALTVIITLAVSSYTVAVALGKQLLPVIA